METVFFRGGCVAAAPSPHLLLVLHLVSGPMLPVRSQVQAVSPGKGGKNVSTGLKKVTYEGSEPQQLRPKERRAAVAH